MANSAFNAGGGSGGASVAFKTLSAAGQDVIVADSATDTLMLSAMGNIAITQHESTDTVVISGAAVTGSTGTLNAIKLNTSQVGGSDIATLDFSSDFTVTESPDTEINVGVAAGLISGLTEVTSTDSDYLMVLDATDSALKKVDAGEFRGGGGATINDFDVMMISEVYR